MPGLGGWAAVDELDLGEAQRRDVAVVVADELRRAHGVHPLAALLVGARDAVEHRVGGPRLAAGRSSPGCGMISRLVTEAAPWRCDVPMQSAPVSPPPMTTTCLPVGEDLVLDLLAERGAVALREELHRLVDAAELAARDVEVARDGGPRASTTAS